MNEIALGQEVTFDDRKQSLMQQVNAYQDEMDIQDDTSVT